MTLSTSVFASNAAQKGGHNQAMDSEKTVQVASAGQEAKRVSNDKMDAEMNQITKTPSKRSAR